MEGQGSFHLRMNECWAGPQVTEVNFSVDLQFNFTNILCTQDSWQEGGTELTDLPKECEYTSE